MESSDHKTEGETPRVIRKHSKDQIQKCKHIATLSEVMSQSISKSDRPDARTSSMGEIGRPTMESVVKGISNRAPIGKTNTPEALRKSVERDWEDYEMYLSLTKTFIS